MPLGRSATFRVELFDRLLPGQGPELGLGPCEAASWSTNNARTLSRALVEAMTMGLLEGFIGLIS